jgi:hypothetical protein
VRLSRTRSRSWVDVLGPTVARRGHERWPLRAQTRATVARGLSNGEIAREFVIEESTVETHVKRILMKLQLRDRVQAVIFAYESRIVRPGSRTAA